MLEGLAGQAASTGPRTGSCCCSCCRSAISVGEARWPDSLELPQCRWSSVVRSPSNCLSAGQLRYTVPVPPDSSSTLSAGASRQLLHTVSWLVCDSSISNPARKRQVGRGAGWGVEGSRLEAWMKSHNMKCWLMSSDVSWHIRDKLWPMPKHGSINLYVHGN